jgi:hypothetical protein
MIFLSSRNSSACFDGLERVTSQTLLDLLEVPQRSRKFCEP